MVSVHKFTTDNKVSIEFDLFGFFVKDFQTGMALMSFESRGDLYPITTSTISTNKVEPTSSFATQSSSLWHDRLGHLGKQVLNSLRQNKLIECNDSRKIHSPFFQSCPHGKHVKLPFMNYHNHSLLPFDILHIDVWTSPVLSSLGHKYYVLFLDDYSNFLWTFPISQKSQVYSCFQILYAYINTQFQKEIKTIQCGNGREYVNNNFQKICETNGIHFRLSCPYTSSQNSKSERKLRSIKLIIWTLLIRASLPWHHALEMATYLLNILPSKAIKFWVTP